MSVLAACSVGLCCALVAAALMGVTPHLAVPRNVFGPRRARNRLWLQQAGAGLTPTRFWVGSIGAGLVALLVPTGLSNKKPQPWGCGFFTLRIYE